MLYLLVWLCGAVAAFFKMCEVFELDKETDTPVFITAAVVSLFLWWLFLPLHCIISYWKLDKKNL